MSPRDATPKRGSPEAARGNVTAARRPQRLGPWAVPIVIIALLAGIEIFVWFVAPGGGDGVRLRAAIVDQLAATDANPEFVAQAMANLENAGYAVDYYGKDEIDVELFRNLPQQRYDLVVVRSHMGQLQERPAVGLAEVAGGLALVPGLVSEPVASIFTNEAYSVETHVPEQRARMLSIASYLAPRDSTRLFGIMPEFILSRSRGNYNDATIILMGCGGPGSEQLAQAFLRKGASAVVGWDDNVTALHTDRATQDLLANMLAGRMDLSNAVARTMDLIGPDASYGAMLRTYTY